MKLDHSYFTFSQTYIQITSNGGVADQVQDGITTFFGSSGVVMMYDRIRYMHDSIVTYILSILNGCGNSISVACEIVVFLGLPMASLFMIVLQYTKIGANLYGMYKSSHEYVNR